MKHIAILDFGSQYTHLIARRIRELGVLAKIYPTDVPVNELRKDTHGIILSGGPQSVYEKQSPSLDAAIFNLDIPVLGLCYGHQLMAHMLGGEVKAGTIKEYGRAVLTKDGHAPITADIPDTSTVWMSHGDTVAQLPEGFSILGHTADCPIAAMGNEQKRWYGFQFHPEVRHSEHGMTMLKNFVFNICRAEQNWNIDNLVEDIITNIREKAGDKRVFLLVSGGVDSNVAFALLTRALGKDRVYGLYIDTGFMRKDESEEIKQSFKNAGFDNIHVLNASDDFLKPLENIVEPEEKRNIIGKTFLLVKDRASAELNIQTDDWLLGQGTIYPDTIETGGTTHADTIKTHHNRIDAIQKLIAEGKVIEPLADFYKDEVRHVGTLLGLPENMIKRHPFPGPGLAIRILCANSKAPREPLPTIEPRLVPELSHAVLPVKSVGVQGDNRTYAHPLAVWGSTEWDALDQIASNISNSSSKINRVLVLLNPGDSPIELSPNTRTLTSDRIALLQTADALVQEIVKNRGLYDEVWQFPVVLVPIGHTSHESIILRPVSSQEAMTAHFSRIPFNIVDEMRDALLTIKGIDYIFYDVTNKPPGTIEWE